MSCIQEPRPRLFLTNRDNDVLVEVEVAIHSESALPSVDTIQVWLLQGQGKAAILRQKSPPSGPPIGRAGSGYVNFMFEKEDRPIAVVLQISDQFMMFAVPAISTVR